MGGGVTATEHALIEHACARLIVAYARYADTFQDEAFAALFSDEALLHRGDAPLVGRSEILAAMGRRRRDAVVRHVMSNIFIEVIDARSARGTSTLTLYRHFGTVGQPVPMREPEMIADYLDRFTLTAAGWRFAERRASIIFKHPDSTH